MKILAICSLIPHPEHRGDPVRVASILRALNRIADLEVWCVNSNNGDVTGLKSKLPGARVQVFDPDERGWIRSRGALFRYLIAAAEGVPVWIRQRSCTALTLRIAGSYTNFDRVVVLGEAAAQYLSASSPGWHWDKVNVLSSSGKAAVREAVGARKIAALINWYAAQRYERRSVARAGSISVTNVSELERFNALFQHERTGIVRSTVPIPQLAKRHPTGKSLLWIGNFSYESNVAGLLRFLRTADSMLCELGWSVRLVGSGLTTDASATLEEFASATLVGFVEDLSEELSTATAGIVPLWSGGGTKMKTLTMLAAGLPVAATKSGVEGLPENEHGAAFLVADEPSELVEIVERAYLSDGLHAVGLRAQELITRTYGEDSLTRDLVASMALHGAL